MVGTFNIDSKDYVFENYDIEEGDPIYKRIYGKSYKENDYVSIKDLTYVKLLHYDYEGNVVEGELIIHKAILEETKEVFRQLFENKYQIYSMKLIDDYWIDDDPIKADRNSVIHNNSSSFCYRNISNNTNLSNHALGIAIDINPYENPYTPRNKDGSFDNSYLTENERELLVNRKEKSKNNPHIITLDDTICQIFGNQGFECGGIWPQQSDLWSCDWQHFEPNIKKIDIIKERIEKIHNSNQKVR